MSGDLQALWLGGKSIRFGTASLDVDDPALDDKALGPEFLGIIQAFVADTFERCAFHRSRLSKAGFTDGRVESMENFRNIPLLTSEEVRSASDSALLPDQCVKGFKGGLRGATQGELIIRKFLTSSSTGAPKGSYYTADDWAAATALGPRMMRGIRLDRYCRLFNCFHGAHIAGKIMEDTFARSGCLVENNHHTNLGAADVATQLASGFKELGGFNAIAMPPWRPRISAANKGVTLDMLLNEDVDNVLGRRIEVAIVGGAPAAREARVEERLWEANALARKPPASFVHAYGSAEVGQIAASCPEGNGLHLLQGNVFVEVIDDGTGQHVSNGETGFVALTGLRHGSRFLRYIVGDQATWIAEPCRCGRTSPRLLDLERVRDMTRLQTGCAAGGY